MISRAVPLTILFNTGGVEKASKYRYPPGLQVSKSKEDTSASFHNLELLPRSSPEPEYPPRRESFDHRD